MTERWGGEKRVGHEGEGDELLLVLLYEYVGEVFQDGLDSLKATVRVSHLTHQPKISKGKRTLFCNGASLIPFVNPFIPAGD